MANDERTLPIGGSDGHGFELIDVGPTDGPVLLFLPGMGISARNLIPFGRALGDHGIRLLIHEWRGNGSSTWRARRGMDWGYDELLDRDLAAALAAARTAATGAPLWLGGHSLGSQLACLAAAADPEDIEGLVLVAGGAPYWRCYPSPAGLGLFGLLHLLPAIGRLLGYYPGKRLGFAGNEARQLMIDWSRTGRTGRYAWRGLDRRALRDEEAALAELAMPVHVIAMEHDRFVPESATDWLLDKLSGCHAARRTVTARDQGSDRADHFGWMQAPAATARFVANAVQGR